MELKELKTLFKISIEQTLLEPLLKVGFKWKKGSMRFQRNKGDFSQSILFFLSPIKHYDDESIGPHHHYDSFRCSKNNRNSYTTKRSQ